MTEAEFEAQVTAMTNLMYYTAASLLSNPYDQQDAIQESIYRAWRNLGKLRNEAAFQPWMMRILVRQCRSVGRRKNREVPTEQMEEKAASDPIEAFIQNHELRQALMQLPEKLRLAITLVCVDGFSYEYAAQILGIPLGTIKSRVNHGRAHLRRILGNEVDEK